VAVRVKDLVLDAADTLSERAKVDRAPYDVWVDQNFSKPCRVRASGFPGWPKPC
jgi:hypothetical protein